MWVSQAWRTHKKENEAVRGAKNPVGDGVFCFPSPAPWISIARERIFFRMNTNIPELTLKYGREDSVLRRHPWIFSGAVHRVEGDPPAGATVRVRDAQGRPLGLAAWSPASQIRARMWTFDADAVIDADFFRQRIAAAAALRAPLFDDAQTNAYRLLASEADLLPGVIVDRYAVNRATGAFIVIDETSNNTVGAGMIV